MGIKPSVLTNGVLIDQKRISFFKQYPPRIIQITLYGSSEDAYERVTGHRVFHTVIHNLRMLRDAEIPVKRSITPNKYMEKEVRSLFETIEEFGFEYTINANLVLPRENTGRDLQDLPIDRYVEIYKISAEMKKNITLSPIDPNELPDDINVSNKKYGLVCGAGRSMFGITYEGKLIPCISLHEISADPIKCGFKNAWKQVNEIVEKYPFPEECGDCVYFKRCLNCVAMHKNAPQKGHCDRRICERTKRLICEGFIPLP